MSASVGLRVTEWADDSGLGPAGSGRAGIVHRGVDEKIWQVVFALAARPRLVDRTGRLALDSAGMLSLETVRLADPIGLARPRSTGHWCLSVHRVLSDGVERSTQRHVAAAPSTRELACLYEKQVICSLP